MKVGMMGNLEPKMGRISQNHLRSPPLWCVPRTSWESCSVVHFPKYRDDFFAELIIIDERIYVLDS